MKIKLTIDSIEVTVKTGSKTPLADIFGKVIETVSKMDFSDYEDKEEEIKQEEASKAEAEKTED